MSKKTVMMFSLCVAIAIMAIAYAAFSTTLTINGTTSQIGTFSLQLIAESASVTGTAGVSGATAPTATCTNTSGATTGTMTATLYQPGDTVTCSWKVKNTGTLKAKANGNATCTVGSGITTSATSSLTTPMWYAYTWEKTALAKSATSGAGEITITINYSSSITSDPTTKTGTVSCTFPYTQNI